MIVAPDLVGELASETNQVTGVLYSEEVSLSLVFVNHDCGSDYSFFSRYSFEIHSFEEPDFTTSLLPHTKFP